MPYLRRRFFGTLAGLLLASCVSASFAAEAPHVALKTSMGEIVLEQYPDKAPKSVEKFLQYVKNGHYNGTIFHRDINGFMNQSGSKDKNMRQKPTAAPIQIEAKYGLKGAPGARAGARAAAPRAAAARGGI